MAPSKKDIAKENAKSCLERRKEYAKNLRKAQKQQSSNIGQLMANCVGKSTKTKSATSRKSLTKPSTASRAPSRSFRTHITAKELEEMELEPLSILHNSSSRNNSAFLDNTHEVKVKFSLQSPQVTHHTSLPKTPLMTANRSILSKSSAEVTHQECQESIESILEGLESKKMDAQAALTDLRGLELKKSDVLQEMAVYWDLKCMLTSDGDDNKAHTLALVNKFFLESREYVRQNVMSKIVKILNDEVKNNSQQHEPPNVPEEIPTSSNNTFTKEETVQSVVKCENDDKNSDTFIYNCNDSMNKSVSRSLSFSPYVQCRTFSISEDDDSKNSCTPQKPRRKSMRLSRK